VPRLLLLLTLLLPALLTQVLVVILRSVVVLPVVVIFTRCDLQDCGSGSLAFHLCCGSVIFWYGSESGDTYLPTYGSCSFYVSGFHDASKKEVFSKDFSKVFCLLVFEGTFTSTSVFKDKK
jgi:hypothetical protein